MGVGDEVFGYFAGMELRRGSYADHVWVDEQECFVAKPPDLDHSVAACLPLCGVVALRCVDAVHPDVGDAVLVSHASGVGVSAWLIDKSALVRLGVSLDAKVWAERIHRGLVRIASVTRLQVGYSARSADELRGSLRQPPMSAMPVEYLTPAIEDRAMAVQALLADHGQRRAPSVPDLLLAATGELAALTVLHVDKDFELIAEVTGQSVERLVLEDTDEANAAPSE